jgi:hypothetical protein
VKLVLLCVVPLFLPGLLPSDPAAAYGIVDKVVFLPDEAQPDRAEIWGRFCVAEGQFGAYYRSARAGYLLVGAGKNPADAVAQWRELAALVKAGDRTVVSFGTRYEMLGMRVAAQDQPRPEPVAYATGWGMRRVENVDYGPARELRLLPRPLQPVGSQGPKAPKGAARPAQQVTFECENCLEQDAALRYVFTVTTSDGEHCASGPVAPGNGRTQWQAVLALQAGEQVTWTVQAVPAKADRVPVASATFVVGVAQEKAER